jgi:hypothetical protein
MYQPLVPCEACARHVRPSDPACPFCGHAQRDVRLAPDTGRRMTRAAAFVFGATVALAACDSDVETRGGDGGQAGSGASGAGGNASLYGAPGGFGGEGAGGSDVGGGQTLYGAPGGFGGDGAGGEGGEGDGGHGIGGNAGLYGSPPP